MQLEIVIKGIWAVKTIALRVTLIVMGSGLARDTSEQAHRHLVIIHQANLKVRQGVVIPICAVPMAATAIIQQ